MKHRQVVVDMSAFVTALDPDADGHEIVRAQMLTLVDQFERNEVLLVTHSDAVTGAVAELLRRGFGPHVVDAVNGLAAVCDVVPLHADHRDHAHEVIAIAEDLSLSLTLRSTLTIELARRRGTSRVFSVDPRLQGVDLDLLP